jgi:hypothetical protein
VGGGERPVMDGIFNGAVVRMVTMYGVASIRVSLIDVRAYS